MNILVTGGCGFIGSNFIRFILAKYPDYKVVNLDNLSYSGNLENLRDIQKNPNFKFVKGDICNRRLIQRIAKDCDCVINFAAQTHVDRSIKSTLDFINTNIMGTWALLESAKKNKIPLFIQISSDEVYGSIDEGSFNEESPLKPNSPYAASKASADLLCRSYWVTHKLPVIITRSSNNFGPYQYPEKIIPLFITNALENKKLPVYGDGLNVRDWLYVIDNCSAIDTVLHKGRTGEIYNIGAGSEKTNLELTRAILKLLKKDKGLIEFVPDRPGHDRRYGLDCAKLEKLGWRPRHNFEVAIALTIKWYKANHNWWRPLKMRLNEDNYHWLKRDAGQGSNRCARQRF